MRHKFAICCGLILLALAGIQVTQATGLPAALEQEGLARLRQAMLESTSEAGPLLPEGSIVSGLHWEGPCATVDLELPPGANRPGCMGPARHDAIIHAAIQSLWGVAPFERVRVRMMGPDGEYHPLADFLPPEPPIVRKEDLPKAGDLDGPAPPAAEAGGQPPAQGGPQPAGALTGKTVWLSAGHGWYYDGASSWLTQRGNTNGIVEDLSNSEAVHVYLAQYLWNAGARVWTGRERNLNTQQAIVDNDGTNGSGSYAEGGTGWFTSSALGFANGNAPYTTEDPFTLGTSRVAPTSTTGVTAWTRWTPSIPEEGDYAVYVSYAASANRSTDARFHIYHTGGASEVVLNQQIHGATWVYLGTYHFAAGLSADAGSVTLGNDSSTAGFYVSADAVRFGGGTGEIQRGGAVSGRPKFEECSRYWAQYQGAPASVYDSISSTPDNDDDVTCRPRLAEFERAAGEDAVFLSWHTNAYLGSSRGTESYIYDGGATTGSTALRHAIHTELINDFRAAYDPAWIDRGELSANFGELRPLSTMPGALTEIAFHDNATDANYLKDPKFRMVAARALCQGIVKYFNPSGVLLPEPPQRPEVHATGSGCVRLSWAAPPTDSVGLVGNAATSYKVYGSADGHGFDGGQTTANLFLDACGLVVGQVRYFRVTALNAGGESFPTEVLAVRVPAGNRAPVLIVCGYDRLDRSLMVPQYESAAIGTDNRMFLEHMNAYDSVIPYARSLAQAGVDFDSSSNEAASGGAVSLANYCGVFWILGKESSTDATFDATERSLVQTYLNGGGALFTSGAEIGWDLDYLNNGRTFYQGTLKSVYRADDAYSGQSNPTCTVSGAAGSAFAGLPAMAFDRTGAATYRVDYPDAIDASTGALACFTYNGATSFAGAGVQYSGAYKLVNLGFPMETLLSAADRDLVMARTVSFFALKNQVTAEVANVRLAPSGADIHLTWNSETNSATYKVSRATSPQGPWTDVTAEDGDASSTDLQYLRTGGMGSGGEFVCFLVKGSNCLGVGP